MRKTTTKSGILEITIQQSRNVVTGRSLLSEVSSDMRHFHGVLLLKVAEFDFNVGLVYEQWFFWSLMSFWILWEGNAILILFYVYTVVFIEAF